MDQSNVRYFFEIPIYRCSYDKYLKDMEQEKEKVIQYFLTFSDIDRKKAEKLYQKHPDRKEKLSWRFNHIIGYLRLYVETGKDAIKVEYWGTHYKRIPRFPLRKKFLWMGWNINEMRIGDDMTSSEIYEGLLELITEIGNRSQFENWYIDLSNFKAMGTHIDWRALVKS